MIDRMSGFVGRLVATGIPLALVTLLATILVRRRALRTRGRAAATRATAGALLCGWTVAVLLWALALSNPDANGTRHLNVIPFREIRRALRSTSPGYVALNLGGNLGVFLVVGALAVLALGRGRRAAWVLGIAAGLGLSVVIELTQYGIGRSADIDDVIMNGLGAALGAVGAWLALRATRRTPPAATSEA